MEIGKIGPTPQPRGYDATRVQPINETKEEQAYTPNQDQHRRESTPVRIIDPEIAKNLDVSI